MNISSFTSASTEPSKLISNGTIIDSIKDHNIIPYHIQLNPTNKCPFNCSFCSCKNRNKQLNLPLKTIERIVSKFRSLGTRACTITGGGDPLAYGDSREQEINKVIDILYNNDIECGLVTNGILLDPLRSNMMVNKLRWCRISYSNESILDLKKLNKFMKAEIDWAFSYVITDPTNLKGLKECIIYANDHNFTHVRIVDDILKGQDLTHSIKYYLDINKIDDSKVIYQGRKEYTHGCKKCLISLVKPNISPDGNIYGCCGIQYSKEKASLDFDKNDSMGIDIEDIWNNQKYYDGSNCIKCYYSDYNNYMNKIWDLNNIQHQDFI